MLRSFVRLWLLMLVFCGILSAQPWVMFSDMDDTYLYDQASGQVYIRIKKGGKNYEDTFVKMGVQDSIHSKPTSKAQKTAQKDSKSTESKQENDAQKEQQELIKKAQELQRSIQGSILGGE
ncbi:hypothetical protein [uncultured Helicobacter sp.]|uniref:hypothetical protein n=1 Tax=uncultured Helicobacter sp. TaxID=175537 RepID=UPI00260ACC3E|nr:hypothetical protein [uncultured Helicobacter sp.]